MTDKEFNKWKRNGNFTVTHERIATVYNHMAEGEHHCYTKKEAMEVAIYYGLECSRLCSEIANLKTEGLLKYAERLIRRGKGVSIMGRGKPKRVSS